MTKPPIEAITSIERRRRWASQDKERLGSACLEPGTVLSELARWAGIHASQFFRWRKNLARSCLRRSSNFCRWRLLTLCPLHLFLSRPDLTCSDLLN